MCILIRQQYKPATRRHDYEDNDQCREDPLASAGVEVGEAEGVLRETPADDRSDKKSGNYKEDIHTNVAAAEGRDAGVKADDGENG